MDKRKKESAKRLSVKIPANPWPRLITAMSDLTDRELGMKRNITRRDFLNGVAVTVGASLMPSRLFAAGGSDPEKVPNYYPPALTRSAIRMQRIRCRSPRLEARHTCGVVP